MEDFVERRQHKRIPLSCLVSLQNGSAAMQGRTLDMSDGGLLLATVVTAAKPKIGEAMTLKLSIPRQTRNSYLLEELSCQAVVVRRAKGPDGGASLALRFERPLSLMLEV